MGFGLLKRSTNGNGNQWQWELVEWSLTAAHFALSINTDTSQAVPGLTAIVINAECLLGESHVPKCFLYISH